MPVFYVWGTRHWDHGQEEVYKSIEEAKNADGKQRAGDVPKKRLHLVHRIRGERSIE
jgi:hypothetical protein